jgi:uncharacterized protein (DUF983 family)
MKDSSIQVIGIFDSHQLIRMETECPHCHGRLYRHFPDGSIICVNCQAPILNTELKLESQ